MEVPNGWRNGFGAGRLIQKTKFKSWLGDTNDFEMVSADAPSGASVIALVWRGWAAFDDQC